MPTPSQQKLSQKVRKLPHKPGVYLMRDAFGHVLYVGKAKDLQKRVSSYFRPSKSRPISQPKVQAMLDLIADVEVIEVKSEAEALILEGKLIKEWKPKHNTELKDDKGFLFIKVEVNRSIPKFKLVYNEQDPKAKYFGPFAHPQLARKTLKEMRTQFGILLADSNPKKNKDGTYSLYDDIRSEIYGHANQVSIDEYRERVNAACSFLEGKGKEWLQDIRKEMQEASADQAFEKAARLRDVFFALEKTLSPVRKFKNPSRLVPWRTQALQELQQVLQLDNLPHNMECFDISHISGTFVVASMVRFSEGKPNKKEYRRYKIKSFIGNDDYRAMEEVVTRRYKRLHESQSPFPDLLIIDGGKGQVHAALKAFLLLDIPPPMLIGLAKKMETIVFPGDRPHLQLDQSNPALKLLQQIRDEAHRFSNQFNAELRSKRIKESILDDLEGLGTKRKELLLKHFKTIARLRQATVDDIQEIEGFGPMLAQKIVNFLSGITP